MNNQTLLFTISNSRCTFVTNVHVPLFLMLTKENRIYIRVEFSHSLGMNFVYKSCKCSLIIYKYINTVCSRDYPFQFRIFKAFK